MYSPTRDKDVIVRLFRAARQHGSETCSGEKNIQLFDAAVYSTLSVDVGLIQSKYPSMLRELPLLGVEQLRLEGGGYDSDLASFVEGEASMQRMRERLLDTMSPNLRRLLTDPPRDIRVWWSSATPELEDLPWELSAGSGLKSSGRRVVFLRGLPAETPIPALPVEGNPRLAVLGKPYQWPEWITQLQNSFSEQVTTIDLPLKQALGEAIRAGFELVHMFADGIVSSALDGILYDHDSRRARPEVHPGELSRLLSGSRVAVLALSRAEYDNPDVHHIAGRPVLSAFRAFAYLGASPLPLPTIMASLGPVPNEVLAQFWQSFYSELIFNWHLTDALRNAQSPLPFAPPVALFYRHAGGKLFRSAKPDSMHQTQPIRIRDDLLRSEQFTRELSLLSAKYKDLPSAVHNLLKEETEHQSRLRGELETWIQAEEEL